jgi:hypothetical protein
LLYNIKILSNDDATLLDYNIHNGSRLRVTIRFGREYYCAGCVLPALVCLSAHVSLQCDEKLSFDGEQLVHSIKTKLTNLNNGAVEVMIGCIETCGHEKGTLQNDDANYFGDHTEQAINLFTGAICNMINRYVEKYRTSKMIEKTKQAINYEVANKSSLSKPIDIDWFIFLYKTRCPICFCRVNLQQMFLISIELERFHTFLTLLRQYYLDGAYLGSKLVSKMKLF